ncbi:unnamed protein product, partial [Chrysoparadoxa australica]
MENNSNKKSLTHEENVKRLGRLARNASPVPHHIIEEILDLLGDPDVTGAASVKLCLLAASLSLPQLTREAHLEAVGIRLKQGLDGLGDAGATASIRLATALPADGLVKLLSDPTITKSLAEAVATHPSAVVRALAVKELCGAVVRCWGAFEGDHFLNGEFESGFEAQRLVVRVKEWVLEYLVKQLVSLAHSAGCDEVSGAAFSVLVKMLQHHPLCRPWVQGEIEVLLLGRQGELQAEKCQPLPPKRGFPLQELSDRVLAQALPSDTLSLLLTRCAGLSRPHCIPAVHCCSMLSKAVMSLCIGPYGVRLKPKMLQRKGGFSEGTEKGLESCGLHPQQLVYEWCQACLVPKLDSIDPGVASAAAIVMVDMLQLQGFGVERLQRSFDCARCLLGGIPHLQATPSLLVESLNHAQLSHLASAVLLLRWIPRRLDGSILPHILDQIQHVSLASQRLRLLAEVFHLRLCGSVTGVTSLLRSSWMTQSQNQSQSQLLERGGKGRGAPTYREELVAALCTACLQATAVAVEGKDEDAFDWISCALAVLDACSRWQWASASCGTLVCHSYTSLLSYMCGNLWPLQATNTSQPKAASCLLSKSLTAVIDGKGSPKDCAQYLGQLRRILEHLILFLPLEEYVRDRSCRLQLLQLLCSYAGAASDAPDTPVALGGDELDGDSPPSGGEGEELASELLAKLKAELEGIHETLGRGGEEWEDTGMLNMANQQCMDCLMRLGLACDGQLASVVELLQAERSRCGEEVLDQPRLEAVSMALEVLQCRLKELSKPRGGSGTTGSAAVDNDSDGGGVTSSAAISMDTFLGLTMESGVVAVPDVNA